MSRKATDDDFVIYVDPSCLSTPMEDEQKIVESSAGEEVQEAVEDAAVPEAPSAEDQDTTAEEEHAADEQTEPQADEVDVEARDEEHILASDAGEDEQVVQQSEEDHVEDEELSVEDKQAEELRLDGNEDDQEDHQEQKADALDNVHQDIRKDFSGCDQCDQCREASHKAAHEQDESFEDEDTPRPILRAPLAASEAQDHEESTTSSRRASDLSQRRTSLRTEALIQAAARAVVAKIEKRGGGHRHSDEHSLEHDLEQDQIPEDGAGERDEGDDSLLSIENIDNPATELGLDDEETKSLVSDTSRRQSDASQIHHVIASGEGETSGDSSSHHDADEEFDHDDVFSARSGTSGRHSARSSVGSFEAPASSHSADEHQDKDCDTSVAPPSPTPSGLRARHRVVSGGSSIISGLSAYDREPDAGGATEYYTFVSPTTDNKHRARVPFRSPSSVRALQMSSPTPTLTPRAATNKRHTPPTNGSPFPTISRLGSPAASAQYSPKGRSTPTRLKPTPKAAPLVLLHVTLLPLRWAWGAVLDAAGLDGEVDVSEKVLGLKDAWHVLGARVGDMVRERGVLLAHPQGDYEVLEERLLEALELPVRRRARILECGHYLGPANAVDAGAESSETEESEYDEYVARKRETERRHWCGTCRHEIRYEDLGGPARVFRVKVYASNGLMRAGAWEACWKEMERVDVEIEPVLEDGVLGELERLAAMQQQQQQQQQLEDEDEEEEEEEEAAGHVVQNHEQPQDLVIHPDADIPRRSIETNALPPTPSQDHSPVLPSTSPGLNASPASPPPSALALPYSWPHSSATTRSEPIDRSAARLRRDAERMLEIYGDTSPPPPQRFPSPTSSMRAESATVHPATVEPSTVQQHPQPQPPRHPDSYIPPPSPRSPSEEVLSRRRRRSSGDSSATTGHTFKEAGLGELLLAAGTVLLRDPRNVAIGVLAVFLVFLAVRPAGLGTGLEGGLGPSVPAVVVGSGKSTVEMVREAVDVVREVGEMVTGTARGASVAHVAHTILPSAERSVDHAAQAAQSSVSGVQDGQSEAEIETVLETLTETVKMRMTATETIRVWVTATEFETQIETETVVVSDLGTETLAELEPTPTNTIAEDDEMDSWMEVPLPTASSTDDEPESFSEVTQPTTAPTDEEGLESFATDASPVDSEAREAEDNDDDNDTGHDIPAHDEI